MTTTDRNIVINIGLWCSEATYLEYLIDFGQVYFASVFQLVDADFLAIKQEQTKAHHLS